MAASTLVDDLITVRDWVRFATSRFTREKLVYGHGTSTALDEAAFLVLSSLSLSVHELEPWLDARLAREERVRLSGLIDARISTRKPAPYLTNEAWIQGHRFYVDERVIVPRSFIGELMCASQLSAVVAEPEAVVRVLDLCTGSGCLAILAALAFPNAEVVGVDISADALDVASRNVEDYELSDRVSLVASNLFERVDGPFDLIISNPPYVTAEAVAAFPPEYRAEPELAHLGGADGLDLVRRILAEASQYLTPDGQLVVEIGQGRELVEEAYPDLPFLWLDTEESEGEVFAIDAAALLGNGDA